MSDALPKLDEDVVALLACPVCGASLTQTEAGLVCTSEDCRRIYRFIDGIPVLLPDEAEVLDADEWAQLLK